MALPSSTCTVVLASVTLAKQPTTGDMLGLFAMLGLLALVIGLLVVLLFVARKAMRGGQQRFGFDEGFSLADLRSLLNDGKITELEYERAKAHVISHGRFKMIGNAAQSNEQDIEASVEPSDETGI